LETGAKLARDRDLWLVGGDPEVKRVILFFFRRTAPTANTVQASVEVWGLDQQGNPTRMQREVRKYKPVINSPNANLFLSILL
jgi:hypothetical protein